MSTSNMYITSAMVKVSRSLVWSATLWNWRPSSIVSHLEMMLAPYPIQVEESKQLRYRWELGVGTVKVFSKFLDESGIIWKVERNELRIMTCCGAARIRQNVLFYQKRTLNFPAWKLKRTKLWPTLISCRIRFQGRSREHKAGSIPASYQRSQL